MVLGPQILSNIEIYHKFFATKHIRKIRPLTKRTDVLALFNLECFWFNSKSLFGGLQSGGLTTTKFENQSRMILYNLSGIEGFINLQASEQPALTPDQLSLFEIHLDCCIIHNYPDLKSAIHKDVKIKRLRRASERRRWSSQSSATAFSIYRSLFLSLYRSISISQALMHCQALFLLAGGWFRKPAYSHGPEGKKKLFFFSCMIAGNQCVIYSVSYRPSYAVHAALSALGIRKRICFFGL